MIVDTHTHYIDVADALKPELRQDMANCGFDPAGWVHTEREYLEATRAADRAIVFGLRGGVTGWDASNERVAQFVKRHSDKYIYFASIDPRDIDAIEQLAHEHRDNGCRGIKLAPIYQGLHPMDPAYLSLYSYAEEHGLAIIFHMGTTFTKGVPIDYTRPMHIDAVACAFPRLKMVIAHMAHPWESEALAVIRRNKNVYADISALYYRPWQFYNSMRLAVEYGCTHKLIFGSDFPATTTADSVNGVLNMNDIVAGSGLAPIPRDVLEQIVYGDSLAKLGIC